MKNICTTALLAYGIALATSASPAAAQTRDAALFAAAEKAQPAVIETLRELVLIESGSGNVPGLIRIADYAEARLKSLGATTERIKFVNSDRVMVKGVLTGSGTLKVMLIAHMDTVYPEGILATQPIRTDGNKMFGPGIADDKGGMAVILHSLAILRDASWKNFAQITVLFNPDEEVGSVGSGETIAKLGEMHDVVLSFEPTSAKAVAKEEGVLLGAAGTATVTLEVKGKASHAGAAPEQGRNALIELSHQILATQDIAKTIPGAQLNWTYSQGGLVRNQIPERAYATADVRLLAPGAAEKLRAALEAKIAESKRVPDTEVSVKMEVADPLFWRGNAGWHWPDARNQFTASWMAANWRYTR